MDHARHTIFGAAALSRGLACLLLTLCLIPGAATTAQAFEAGRHAAPPQGAESEYEQQMRTQRILQMLDDIERLAKEHAREERRAKAARDGGGPDRHAAQVPSRYPQAEAGTFTAASPASLLEDRRVLGVGLLILVVLAFHFLVVQPFLDRRRGTSDAPTDAQGGGYEAWKRQRRARGDKFE